jgi:hypothetical protein
MSRDEQDSAESVDEEMLGAEQATSDEVAVDPAPDAPLGLPFADADVTDESFAERSDREEPEVWEQPLLTDTDDDLVIVDTDLLDQLDEDGDPAEPD